MSEFRLNRYYLKKMIWVIKVISFSFKVLTIPVTRLVITVLQQFLIMQSLVLLYIIGIFL